MNFREKLLEFFFKNVKKERDEAGESDSYFIGKLTIEEKKDIIKIGEKFVNKTDLIRADFYYRMKDSILDANNDEFKNFDPRSLAYMLDRVMSFDATLINEVKESLTIN